jgi:methylenetetrahydrofolate reductase (NADPH)
MNDPIALAPIRGRAAAVAHLAAAASLEATAPQAEELDEIRALLPARTAIYVSAVPGRAADRQLEVVRQIADAGFEAVPHLAARNFGSIDEVDRLLKQMSEAAPLRRVLVIGGDRDTPPGSLHAAIEVIDSGVLEANGITGVGIAAYPEGHPRIAPDTLAQALSGKLAAAARHGLHAHVVTQFSMSAAPILDWLRLARRNGLTAPVRIGIAGPASIKTLIRFAAICGVRNSLQGLARNAGLLKNLLTDATPDAIVEPLAAEAADLGEIALHLFSFGGLAKAARWLRRAAEELERA